MGSSQARSACYCQRDDLASAGGVRQSQEEAGACRGALVAEAPELSVGFRSGGGWLGGCTQRRREEDFRGRGVGHLAGRRRSMLTMIRNRNFLSALARDLDLGHSASPTGSRMSGPDAQHLGTGCTHRPAYGFLPPVLERALCVVPDVYRMLVSCSSSSGRSVGHHLS